MVVMLSQNARWSLGWETPIPLWGWLLVTALIVGVVLWAYGRLPGPRWPRMVAGMLRGLALLLVVGLLAGPQVIWSRDRIEPDRVMVLIDRSLSMSLTDAGFDELGEPRTRDAAARSALVDLSNWIAPEPRPDQRPQPRETRWLGFGDNLQSLAPQPDTWPEPVGRSTELARALEAALDGSDPATLAGIVLVSDGRIRETLPPELLESLRLADAPVQSVVVGGSSSLGDLAVVDVQAPEAVFLGDRVPVRVVVRGQVSPASAEVRLTDQATGEVLDRQPLAGDTVRLLARPDAPGERTWVVEVLAEGDRLAANNRRERAIRVVDRPVRVLLVDGYPRWEFRYLKNLLLREQSVELSSLLLSADRGFAQEGDIPIQRFPEDEREIEPYDLIILGDIPPGFLTDQQASLVLDHIGLRGAGLIWIGGQQHLPASYAGSPLETLLPTLAPSSMTGRVAQESSWEVRPAPAARALGLIDPSASDRRRGMFWMQTLLEPKPAAQPLYLATHPTWPEGVWAVTSMRYGAGQTLYLATDEWWRWRYGQGEGPYAEFWLPLIRLAVRDRLGVGGSDAARLSVAPGVITLGQTAVVEWEGPVGGPASVTILRQGLPAGTVDLLPESTGPSTRWSARLLPDTPGLYTLSAGANGPQARLTVLDDTPEYLQTEPDRALLAGLAERTGGKLYELEEASALAGAIPSRARTVIEETREPIWSSVTVFTVLIGLLTAEWITRRIAGLS